MTDYDDEQEGLRMVQNREQLREFLEVQHEKHFSERSSSWRFKECSLVIRSKIPRGEKLVCLKEMSRRFWNQDKSILPDLEAEITRLKREIEDEQRKAETINA